MAYNGTVEVISGLKQKNNGTFPLVHASAVQVDDDDTRLDELLEGMDSNIKQNIDDLIMVQNTQPTSEYNEVWIKSTGNEVQIPTYEEFENLADNTVHLDEQTLTDVQKTAARDNIGSASQADLTNLKSEIKYYNAFNCVPIIQDTKMVNGVTYTISAEGISASGYTGATAAPYSLFREAAKIPDGLEVGKTYYIDFEADKVNLVIYAYDGTSSTELFRTKTSTTWTVPATLTPGCMIRLLVPASTSQFSETFDYPMILNTRTNSQLFHIIESLEPAKGVLANGTDFNNVKNPGVYFINGSTNYNYTNSPLPAYIGGTLEVFTSGTNPVQRVTRYSNGAQFIRTGTASGNFANRDWNPIGKVNNYLESPGDTTDMTGAIQTMLNTTGVCHLGPGDFYVTGVEIPDRGVLIGSGNKTNLVLASSVTSGYAIKLMNYGTVENLRISGQLSGSPSSTVGTRHGILYQGTASSSSDPSSARRFYGFISNVFIASFSGGGITCISTGGQVNSNLVVDNCHIRSCGAGINVALYSEFHRFTNISATNCYYGCICNGGNCNFVNCSFSYCQVGILMEDYESSDTHTAPNNSHGTFSACTVCHSGTNNDGIALKLIGLDNCEIFVGMQIFFGSVIIDECVGIRFIGGNFGNATPMTITDSTVVTFSECQMISASASSVTQSGNTSLKFVECYNRDGTVFNPMA